MPRGPTRLHTRAELDHMRELYFRKDENWSVGDIARFYRTTIYRVNQAIEGKAKAIDDLSKKTS